ncbi:MAG TPA: YciI family protein [Actinomycetota bacterium]|nr:YciI family protein [Actinomycetota bacterium]
MQYLLLIYGDEQAWESMMPEEQGEAMQGWTDYTQWLKDTGLYLGGDALAPTTAATTVRVRDGQTLTTDGPFAETKEQLGGYYLIEAANLDDAIAAAARCPGAFGGTMEVRPVVMFDEEGHPSS